MTTPRLIVILPNGQQLVLIQRLTTSGYRPLDEEYVPRAFNIDKTNDAYYQGLQQTMMDFGWRLMNEW